MQSTAAIVAEIEDTRRWLTGRFRKGTALSWDDEAAWNLTPDVTLEDVCPTLPRCAPCGAASYGAHHRREALMFWRRWISGIHPLLVWAEDERAADITAVIHAASLPAIESGFFIEPSEFKFPRAEDES